MKPKRLQFGRTPETPKLDAPGIALYTPGNVFALDGQAAIRISGCARAAKKDSPADKKALAGGIFITAVEAYEQHALCANLLQHHILFEDDMVDAGKDYVISFSFDLMQSVPIPMAPFTFFVHASFLRHVSNCLVIQLTGQPSA